MLVRMGAEARMGAKAMSTAVTTVVTGSAYLAGLPHSLDPHFSTPCYTLLVSRFVPVFKYSTVILAYLPYLTLAFVPECGKHNTHV